MKIEKVSTLQQLLDAYNKSVEVPQILVNVSLAIYGERFIEAIKRNEPWIDEAVDTYLGTDKFLKDLQKAEKEWKEGLKYDYFEQWLQLECGDNRQVHLMVDMDLKDF